MLVALEREAARQHSAWTPQLEISAVTAELLHALLLVTLKVNRAKNVGKPLRFPRPWEQAEEKKLLSMREFVKMTAAGG